MFNNHALAQHGLAHCHLEPVYWGGAGLWLYGNLAALSGDLAYVPAALGQPQCTSDQLSAIERGAEEAVLAGKVLVTGIHNFAHRRAAVVPLRWGAPRICVFSGGIRFHLGDDLLHEPFRSARLWRYRWDAGTDLAVSRRSPDKAPTFASHNPTVDKVIRSLVERKEKLLKAIVAS